LVELAKGAWRSRGMLVRLLVKGFLLNKREFERAFRCALSHLKGRPRDTRVLVFMAHALRLKGNFREAIKYLRRVVKIDPKDVENWIDLAFTYRNAGYIKKSNDILFNLELCTKGKSVK